MGRGRGGVPAGADARPGQRRGVPAVRARYSPTWAGSTRRSRSPGGRSRLDRSPIRLNVAGYLAMDDGRLRGGDRVPRGRRSARPARDGDLLALQLVADRATRRQVDGRCPQGASGRCSGRVAPELREKSGAPGLPPTPRRRSRCRRLPDVASSPTRRLHCGWRSADRSARSSSLAIGDARCPSATDQLWIPLLDPLRDDPRLPGDC